MINITQENQLLIYYLILNLKTKLFIEFKQNKKSIPSAR